MDGCRHVLLNDYSYTIYQINKHVFGRVLCGTFLEALLLPIKFKSNSKYISITYVFQITHKFGTMWINNLEVGIRQERLLQRFFNIVYCQNWDDLDTLSHKELGIWGCWTDFIKICFRIYIYVMMHQYSLSIILKKRPYRSMKQINDN